MLLPYTAKQSINALFSELSHQGERRTQFDLTVENPKAFEEVTSALSLLLPRPFATSEEILHRRREVDRFDVKTAFSDFDNAEKTFVKLGLHKHVLVLFELRGFVSGDHDFSPQKIGEDRHRFADVELENQRLKILSDWEDAQAEIVPEDVIAKIAEYLDITFVDPTEYDLALVEEITNSTAFHSKAEDPKTKVFLGSDGDLRNTVQENAIELKFFFWTLTAQSGVLACSNTGILAIPNPGERLEDRTARFWPSGDYAFTVQTEIVERTHKTQKHLKNFTNAVEYIDGMQKRLQPWVGGALASIFARFCNLKATYRFFFHLGGFGCSSTRIIQSWGSFFLSALILVIVAYSYNLQSIFSDAFAFGGVSFSRSSWAILTVISFLLLCIMAIVHLVSGVGVLHGTVLRGLNRQYIQGAKSLPDTGKTNFVLRLMQHKNHSV